MTGKTILISGASIAGPALAYWLRRYGFQPTVVERAAAPRPGGQGVDVRGAAVDVAERMGLMDEIRANDTAIRGMSYVDENGRTIAELDSAFGIIDERDAEISRGELTRILYNATRDDVEYVFSDSISGITEDADGVDVRFERCAPRRFDLVFGDETRFLHHLGLYLAISSLPNTTGLDHWQAIHARPGKVATLGSSRDRDQAMAVFFFGSAPLRYDHRGPAPAAGRRVRRNRLGGAPDTGGHRRRAGLLLRLVQPGPDGQLAPGPGRAARRRRLCRVGTVRSGQQPGPGRRVRTGR
jgi:hypothetical protein